MVRILSRAFFILVTGFCLAACGNPPPPVNAPTAMPSLSADFWVDYPSVKAGHTQSANLVVQDPAGNPVSGATAVLEINAKGYKREYYFQLTDADGRARVTVDLPPAEAGQVVLATVTVVDSSTNRWAKTETQFEILPDTK